MYACQTESTIDEFDYWKEAGSWVGSASSDTQYFDFGKAPRRVVNMVYMLMGTFYTCRPLNNKVIREIYFTPIPDSEIGTDYVVVIKTVNNGDSYLISPHILPWIKPCDGEWKKIGD